MANVLWYDSTINTNALSGMFNQLYSKEAINIVRKKNGLAYSILGKKEAGSNPYEKATWERLNTISGYQIEFRDRGKLLAGLATVADGSAEVATNTPDYVGNRYGAMLFDLTHYVENLAVPRSEMDRIKGNEAKTVSWIQDQFTDVMLTIEKEIGTQINSANAPARTQLGGWPWAASDGVTSGETAFSEYGNIDRSQSSNIDFRGQVVSSSTFDLNKLSQLRNLIIVAGGTPDVAIAAATVYNIAEAALTPYTIIDSYSDLMEFGSLYFRFRGMNFMLDKYAPASTLGVLDSSSWVFYLNESDFVAQGLTPRLDLVAAYGMQFNMWIGFLCKNPQYNGKLVNITN